MSGAVKAVTGVFKSVVNVVSSVVKAVVDVVGSVVNMVLSPFMGLFGSPDIPDQSQAIKGVLVQQVGSNVRVPVVYGYRQVAGAVVFCETGSSNNKYLWAAYVFSEGPVHQMQELFINDIQISNSVVSQLNSGSVVAINDGSKFAGRTTLQFFKGNYHTNPASTGVGAAVKADLFSESPSFTTDMNFNGLAVLFARYEWKEATTQAEADNNPFSGSIPQVKISLQGRKVASLTNTGFDSSNVPTGTSGIEAYTYGGSGYTEAYSHNPAEILLDYLRNPRYGKGLSNDEIDWNAFYTAAYKCRTQVNYVIGNNVRGDALALHYVLDTGSTIFNNVKLLLQNFRGYLPYNRGKFALKIEDAGNPTDITSGVATVVKTFTKDNIFGDIVYTGIDRSAKYNQVVVKYVDPDNKWSEQTVVYPTTEAERLTYIAADGGRENKGEFTFAGITNYSIAFNHAKIIFMKSRFQDSLSFTAGSEAFDLEPGDCIYLDANILKFGVDPLDDAIPWRIVTTKLNQDYTFDISCVRNPDSIYPHTRIGERDYHIGVFVPDGAQRKYPLEPVGTPIGLNPPGAAALPLPPLDLGKLKDAVTIDQATYVVENGLTYAVLEYYQPDVPQYFATAFWWKVTNNAVTVWTRFDNTNRVEAGAVLRQKIGPLVADTSYEVRTRVQYTNGMYSNTLNKITIKPASTGTENPVDYVQTSYDGWGITPAVTVSAKNTRVETLTIRPVLVAGAPSTPKKLRFSGKEFYTGTLNPNVIGFKLYYKQNNSTYWQERDVRFNTTYRDTLGVFSFDLDDVGVASYPGTPGAEQYWDFILKYAYNDGTFSTVQLRGTQLPTEKLGSAYDFDLLAPPANVQFAESSVGKIILTESMAPPGAVIAPLDTTIGLKGITAGTYGFTGSQLEMRFRTYLPNLANRADMYGITLYWRPVIQGSAPNYSSKDFFPLSLSGSDSAGDIAEFYLKGLTIGQKYEFLIVPVVNDSGVKKETTQCWFAVGTPTISAGALDLINSMGWKLTNTLEAKKTLVETFPITDPVPQVISWARIHASDTWEAPWSSLMSWYYQLRVQVPTTGFEELHIYRRYRPVVSYASNPDYAKYYGTGRWERLVLTTANHTFVDGVATVNLRPPVSFVEFNEKYGIRGDTQLLNLNWLDAYTPYLKPIDTNYLDSVHEFLLVLKVSGTVSVVGSLLPMYKRSATSSVNKPTVEDISQGQIPPKVLLSDYNTYDVGYNRNLNEYRSSTTIANTNLIRSTLRYPDLTYEPPIVTPGVK